MVVGRLRNLDNVEEPYRSHPGNPIALPAGSGGCARPQFLVRMQELGCYARLELAINVSFNDRSAEPAALAVMFDPIALGRAGKPAETLGVWTHRKR